LNPGPPAPQVKTEPFTFTAPYSASSGQADTAQPTFYGRTPTPEKEMEYIIRAMKLISRDLLGEAKDHHPLAVVWGPDVKPSFITWMRQNGKDERYIKICVRYLDRFVTEPIRTPEDVLKCFERCRSHNLDRALRNLLNFYRDIKGYDEGFILKLKRAIPHIKTGTDEYVPTEERIVETFKVLRTAPLKYRVLWWLGLMGVRFEHGIRALNELDFSRAEDLKGFYYLKVGWDTGPKKCYVIVMPKFVYEMIMEFKASGGKLKKSAVDSFRRRLKRKGMEIEPVKYVRDFAYNAMLQVGIPESLADYLNGRGPQTVGAKHYLEKKRQIITHYSKYMAYLGELRAKIETGS